tara:strand:+ start:761 stop:1438 length:678 start_codon:yes stop_codon:yes gene_type:complete
MAYTKPSWMQWDDLGGQWFGDRDVTKALRQGVNPQNILDFLKGEGRAGASQDAGGLVNRFETDMASAGEGRLTTSLGGSGSESNRKFTGHADIAMFHGMNPDMAIGKRYQAIRDQWHGEKVNPIAFSDPTGGYGSLYSEVQRHAERQDEQDASDLQIAQHQATLDQQAEEAAKVRSSRSSRVQGGSAMSIAFKRSDAARSGAGASGTKQFARSGAGSNVKTLNIA